MQERGGEATVEVLSLLHDMSDAQGERVSSPKLPPLDTYTPFLCQWPSVSPVSSRLTPLTYCAM